MAVYESHVGGPDYAGVGRTAMQAAENYKPVDLIAAMAQGQQVKASNENIAMNRSKLEIEKHDAAIKEQQFHENLQISQERLGLDRMNAQTQAQESAARIEEIQHKSQLEDMIAPLNVAKAKAETDALVKTNEMNKLINAPEQVKMRMELDKQKELAGIDHQKASTEELKTKTEDYKQLVGLRKQYADLMTQADGVTVDTADIHVSGTANDPDPTLGGMSLKEIAKTKTSPQEVNSWFDSLAIYRPDEVSKVLLGKEISKIPDSVGYSLAADATPLEKSQYYGDIMMNAIDTGVEVLGRSSVAPINATVWAVSKIPRAMKAVSNIAGAVSEGLGKVSSAVSEKIQDKFPPQEFKIMSKEIETRLDDFAQKVKGDEGKVKSALKAVNDPKFVSKLKKFSTELHTAPQDAERISKAVKDEIDQAIYGESNITRLPRETKLQAAENKKQRFEAAARVIQNQIMMRTGKMGPQDYQTTEETTDPLTGGIKKKTTSRTYPANKRIQLADGSIINTDANGQPR